MKKLYSKIAISINLAVTIALTLGLVIAGTLFIPKSTLALGDLDQEWNSLPIDIDYPVSSDTSLFSNIAVAQKVQVGLAGSLTQIDLYLGKIGSGGGDYTIALHSANATTTPQASFDSFTLDADDITVFDWYSFDVSNSPHFSVGDEFWIVFSRAIPDGSNYISWRASDGYIAGYDLYKYDSVTTFTTPFFLFDWDGHFRSYMTYTPECGNELVDPAETCDDGNLINGDGCDNLCQIEIGYECTGEPSICSPICGDGIIISPETCDDVNTFFGDGCDSSCHIETSWQCSGTPSTCLSMPRCWQDCSLGNDNSYFDVGTVCGAGDALNYPHDMMPFCGGVICWSTCDQGEIFETYNAGTVCGAGDALNYPHDSQPHCKVFYPMNCNVKHFNLCESQTSCEALGSDYSWDNACFYKPNPDATFLNEIDALNALIDQNEKIISNQNTQSNIQSDTLPLQTLILFAVTTFFIIIFLYKLLFK